MNERNYICDRETYLKLRGLQIQTAETLKKNRIETQQYYKKRADFYHIGKGTNVPQCQWFTDHSTNYERDGFIETIKTVYPELDARGLNIVYGIIKGKKYKQIEPKIQELNDPMYVVLRVCEQLKFDQDLTTAIREEVENG